MRFQALKRRVGRAEGLGAPSAPSVCFVGPEGRAAALRAFATVHGSALHKRPLLLVPCRSVNAESFAERFKRNQTEIVKSARSERPAAASPDAVAPAVEHASIARAREVIAAAKTPPKTPTFSAANRPLSRAALAKLAGISTESLT